MQSLLIMMLILKPFQLITMHIDRSWWMSMQSWSIMMHVSVILIDHDACQCNLDRSWCMSVQSWSIMMHVSAILIDHDACQCNLDPSWCMSVQSWSIMMHVSAILIHHDACQSNLDPSWCMSVQSWSIMMHVSAILIDHDVCQCNLDRSWCMSVQSWLIMMHVSAILIDHDACQCNLDRSWCMSVQSWSIMMHVSAILIDHDACHCNLDRSWCMSVQSWSIMMLVSAILNHDDTSFIYQNSEYQQLSHCALQFAPVQRIKLYLHDPFSDLFWSMKGLRSTPGVMMASCTRSPCTSPCMNPANWIHGRFGFMTKCHHIGKARHLSSRVKWRTVSKALEKQPSCRRNGRVDATIDWLIWMHIDAIYIDLEAYWGDPDWSWHDVLSLCRTLQNVIRIGECSCAGHVMYRPH